MRIVMAQRNPLVGDIEGNARAVIDAAREVRTLDRKAWSFRN